MPKDRKRKNMLIIACIMLFAILFTLVPSFSFSVTAARRNTGSVAEEYVRYQVQASEYREDHGSGGKRISFVRGSGICHAASESAGGYAGGGSG